MTMHDIVHRLSSVLKIVLGQEETMISHYFLLVGSNTLQTLSPPPLPSKKVWYSPKLPSGPVVKEHHHTISLDLYFMLTFGTNSTRRVNVEMKFSVVAISAYLAWI